MILIIICNPSSTIIPFGNKSNSKIFNMLSAVRNATWILPTANDFLYFFEYWYKLNIKNIKIKPNIGLMTVKVK